MSLEKTYKINNLIKNWKQGTVYLTSWLTSQGYSDQLLHRYKKSNWIESVGNGAVKQSGDNISIEGALYALQNQGGSNIHIGGISALSRLGKSHYLEMNKQKVVLFGEINEKLPTWLMNYPWEIEIDFYGTSFLPKALGMVQKEFKNFSIQISSEARAIMECLYLTPQKQSLIECFEIMEGLNNLHPKLVQKLLEECSSVKVKRLFLYMADKAEHSWLNYIDLKNVDLGRGNRSFEKGGVFISKYKIVIPRELEKYGEL